MGESLFSIKWVKKLRCLIFRKKYGSVCLPCMGCVKQNGIFGHCKSKDWDQFAHLMVQSRQPFTYRLRESVGLGGPRWHGSSWQRGIAESGSSQPSTLMIDIPRDLVWNLPCVQQASYLKGGANWCGCCPFTCMLIKNPIMIWYDDAALSWTFTDCFKNQNTL